MSQQQKWVLVILAVVLCIALIPIGHTIAQKMSEQEIAQAQGTTHLNGNDAIEPKASRTNADRAFAHPPEWYPINWPSEDPVSPGHFGSGIHTWENANGKAVGEIEVKDSLPWNGIFYRQGASDYRMVQNYADGKIKDTMDYFLRDGEWNLMSVVHDGKTIYRINN